MFRGGQKNFRASREIFLPSPPLTKCLVARLGGGQDGNPSPLNIIRGGGKKNGYYTQTIKKLTLYQPDIQLKRFCSEFILMNPVVSLSNLN